MQKPEAQIMQSFIDKLCDHLPIQRVKLLIDNGFDEWETITYMKGQQLIDLGFDTQQCIVIMVAANSNARENESTHIFSEQKMQELISKAKQNDLQKQQKMKRQQAENKKQANKQAQGSMKSVPSAQNIKEYPHKDISEALILKGTFMKPKQGQKISLNKVSVVTLEQKEITQITNLQKCPNLVNLHLGNNYIYKIEGLRELTKIKMLKLQHNNIRKIEGLQTLINLEHLYLSSNYIQRLQNLQHNKKLQQLFISKQKIKTNFTFDAQTTQALAYTLQKLQCNQNNIKNITNLKYLTVVKEVYLVKNELEDIGELSQTISGLQNLRILSFKDNPLTKSQKYRDYIVILSKTLQQLDGKPILAKEREYLVKLYALKHAKQSNEEKPKAQQKPNNMDLKGVKLQEEYGYANLNKATDLRGNGPHINTKHVRR